MGLTNKSSKRSSKESISMVLVLFVTLLMSALTSPKPTPDPMDLHIHIHDNVNAIGGADNAGATAKYGKASEMFNKLPEDKQWKFGDPHEKIEEYGDDYWNYRVRCFYIKGRVVCRRNI